MKKLLTLLLFAVSIAATAQKDVPYLSGRVNDEAHVLSSEAINKLDQLLKAHEDSTSNQIVVLIINSLEGEVLEEYSLSVAETWKIGQKGKDNGVLLLVALKDRKMRIEVGYGLEGDLTDALSSRIIRNEIAPYFRQEDYDGGIEHGVEAIIGAINGSYTAGPEASDELMTGDEFIPWYIRIVMGLVFLLVVGMFTYIALMSKGCMSWFLFLFLIPFYATFPMFIFGVTLGVILLACYLLGFLYFKIFYIRSGKGKKWYTTASTKFASSSSSGSGWSSSSGGSSFSGGGGSFGGGGSSGSW